MKTQEYREDGEWVGIGVHVAPKGWVVAIRTCVQGQRNGRRVLVPWAAVAPWPYGAQTPLESSHNESYTVGGLIADLALLGAEGVRVLRRGDRVV